MISPTYTYIAGAFKAGRVFKQVPSYPVNSGAPQVQRTSETHRLNPEGLVEELGTGVPRQDWDVNKGKVSDYPCLSFRQKTDNYTKYTQEFNNGLWQKTGGFISADRHTGPDGLQSAERFTTQATSTACFIHQNLDVKVTDSTIYCSVWVRDGGGDEGNPGTGYFTMSIFNNSTSTYLDYLTVDIVNGIAVDGGPKGIMIKEYPDKWFRVGFFTETSPGSSGTFQLRLHAGVNSPESASFPNYLNTGSASGQQIQFWGANITKTKYAMPYIKADGSFTDLEDDNFHVTALQDHVNSPEGIFFIHLKMAAENIYLSNSQAVISLNSSSTTNGIFFNFKSGSPNFAMNITVNGSSQSFYSQTLDFNEEIKLAVYYKTDYCELFYNGSSVNIDTNFVTFGSRMLQRIDNDNGGGFNQFHEGDLYQMRFYDVRTLSPSQIKELQRDLTQ